MVITKWMLYSQIQKTFYILIQIDYYLALQISRVMKRQKIVLSCQILESTIREKI